MTQKERSADNQTQGVSDREEELQRLQERRSELIGGIAQIEKDSSESVDNLAEYTDQVIADYEKDLEALKAFGQKVKTEAVRSLEKVAKKAGKTVDSALSYFRIQLIVVFISLVTIGAIGGYLFVVYIPSQEISFLSLWAMLSTVVLVSSWFLHRSLSSKDLHGEVTTESTKLVEITSSRPQPVHDLSPMKRFTKSAMNAIKGLTASALEMVPNGDKIIKLENKRLKQQRFVDDFIFALRRYSIDASKETRAIMITKSWVLDDQQNWLTDVSCEISTIFKNVDFRVFQLIYYEFFDEKYASKLWSEIRDSEEIRRQISWLLIERKLITTPNDENSLHIIATLLERLPQYSLEEIEARASNFFSDLAKFKDSCRRHLAFYGLHIIEKNDLLSQYVPHSPDTSKWRDEVMSYIAEQIVVKRPIDVKLLIESAEGDQERTKIWTEIVESDELEDLAAILALERIRPKYGDFEEETFLSHLRLAMAQNRDEFSLTKIQTSLEALENEILSTKYRIQHTIGEYRLGPVNLNFISSFVPSTLSTVEMELLSTISEKLGIDLEIVSLLYCSANGLDRAQELYDKLVGTPKIKELAQLLIKKSFIAESKFSANTVHLLRTQSSFSLSRFVSVYVRYESLFESLDAFYPFLKANGLLSRKPMDFQEVLAICPISSNDSLENQFVKIASKLTINTIDEIVLGKEQHSDLALASVALFMRTHGYTGYSQLCKTASRREFATKVLFQYITLVAEQTLSGSRETLKNATKRAVKGIVDIGNYEYFQTELADGKLAPSAVFLFSQFREEIKTELKNLQDKGFESQTLTNYLEAIKELLDQRIDEKVVREFLLNQVLSAYLLTVPGGVPGIRFVTNALDYIHRAEKELASSKGDSTYIDMVHLSKGGGKATRIGLVPLELGFDDFSAKFNEVWSLAVTRYNDVEDNKIPVPLPCYITRIFPSEDGLKEIMPSDDIKTKPLEVVRELIRDSITSEDSVSLLSLIQKAPNGKVALVKVIQAIFDTPRSNLLMIVADHVNDILSKSQTLMKKFERKEIDASLFHDYQVTHISHLGKKIAEQSSAAGAQVALSEFKERTNKAMGDKTGISSEETEILVGIIFKRLYSIGIALII